MAKIYKKTTKQQYNKDIIDNNKLDNTKTYTINEINIELNLGQI